MPTKKFTIIIAVLLLSIVGLLLAADNDDSIKTITGKLKYDKANLFLQTDTASYRLLLAPKAALDSLGIVLTADSTATVSGKLEGKILIARNLTLGANSYTLGANSYTLRDAEMSPLWSESSTYNVVFRTCIGCRLCVSNCPVGAISMNGRKAVIDQSKCVECGICTDGINTYKGCPVKAINKK